ncbi:ATP-binding protein [Streptacidiphilus sp. PB12-B1b]|uniref:ATP-binding protein n=1 Tax=Streptacidiphilus sp. PB12-B1b TaxID=2705012 RepID=UPI0015FC9570|nr:ATP-binding protein [Streptacidiphilus sp. PB12-B1b]QMU77109.1 ATP-binding protein [Streptacidiphilus sp. PB12-B1b]
MERWPLDGGPGTLARARDRTREFLDALPGVSQTVLQDGLILVTELVSNAMRHAPGPAALELADRPGEVTIAVSDSSTRLPEPRAADLTAADGGFGWHLVQRLSQAVRVQLDPPHGKTVSATLALDLPRSRETMAG